MLEISAKGSAATLRQITKGKLIQLGHEPRNIQVIVSKVDSRSYLVDDSGIIVSEVEHVSNETVVEIHMVSLTNKLHNEMSLHKELLEAHLEIEGLRNELSGRDAIIDTS